MKTGMKRLFLFACDYEDGGERYYLEVELVYGRKRYYQCRITSIADSFLLVDKAGKLRCAGCDQVVIDVKLDNRNRWVDLDFGHYPLIDKLGYLIEKHTT